MTNKLSLEFPGKQLYLSFLHAALGLLLENLNWWFRKLNKVSGDSEFMSKAVFGLNQKLPA